MTMTDRGPAALSDIWEAIACGVVVQDPDGRIRDANAVAEALLGQPVAELRGQALCAAFEVLGADGQPLPGPERPTAIAVRTRQPVRAATLGLRWPDGRTRWLQLDAVPLLDASGAVTHVVSTCIDITERKRTEDAL